MPGFREYKQANTSFRVQIDETCRENRVLAIVLIVLSTKPYAVQLNGVVDAIWNVSVLVAIATGLIVCGRNRIIKQVVSTPTVLLASFCALYCAITLLSHPQNTAGAFSESARIILGYSTVSLLCRRNPKVCMKAIKQSFTVLLLADCITVLISQWVPIFGGSNYSFLGMDNYAVFFVLPMLGSVFAASYYLSDRITLDAWALAAVCLLCKIATHAATSIIALTVLILLALAVSKKETIARIINLYSGILMLVVFTVGVCVFQVQMLFAPLFEMMGKDVTLSYRTRIWDKTIQSILASPLFGYGKTGNGTFQEIVGFSPEWDVQANHTHNYVLELLFVAGVVGIAIYIIYLVCSSGRPRNTLSGLVHISLFSFSVLMMTDSYIFISPFYILIGILQCGYGSEAERMAIRRGEHFKHADLGNSNVLYHNVKWKRA